MNRISRLAALAIGIAAGCSIGAAVLANAAGAEVAALAAGLSAAFALVSLPWSRQRGASSEKPFAEKTAELAEEERRLVMYDQETGLQARWYAAMRCDEECYRSVRYKLPFTILVVEPTAASDSWQTRGQLVHWLAEKRRRSDSAGTLGDGRYVLLMPETDAAAAYKAVARLHKGVDGIQTGLAYHLEDGGNFEQLVEAATSKLGEAATSRLGESLRLAA